MNLLCRGSVPSPFYKNSPNFGTYWTFAFILFITATVFCFHKRARIIDHKVNPMMTKYELKSAAKKSFVFALVYFSLAVPLYYFSKTMIYPGIIIDLWGEQPPDTPDIYGEELTFVSSHDDKTLRAYHTYRTAPSTFTNSYTGENEVVPVIMFGGNGGSGWDNVFIDSFLQNSSKCYDIYSFSYRGYEPNVGLGFPSEGNILDDSFSFFKFVQSRYPNYRVIITSHSLGTGPASAVVGSFSQNEVACVVLGMPFSTMTQTAQEVAYYTPTIYFWAIDSWRSIDRVRVMDKEIPLAVLSAGQDELIAPHHQVTMHRLANSANKIIIQNEEATHNFVGGVIYSNIDAYRIWYENGCDKRVNK